MGESTLGSVLASGRPRNPALVTAGEERTISYEALAAAVDDLAGRLRTVGAERGDRIALVAGNGVETIELLLAIGALGAAAAPLNPSYTLDEHRFFLGDLAPTLLLLPAGEQDAARLAAPAATRIVDVRLPGDGSVGLELDGAGVGTATPFEPGRAGDVALLLHTSGTTSRPKQVPLLHRNLAASATAIADHYRLDETDVSYCAMPLFHVHGLVASALAALRAGGTVVVPRRLSPARFWEHLRMHGVTWLSAGPTLHHMLLEKQPRDAGTAPSLRFARSCSSPLSPALLARAEQRYGVPMLEAYGMTEASHQISSNPLPPAPRPVGSVGVPTGTEIAVVDGRGNRLADGVHGEVAIRGPGVTPGYLENPEANAASFFDGWFRTGDQGVLEDGYLRLVGRLKEMVIRGGENVSPLEVEEVLLGHPAVVDAVAFGIRDEKYGEEVAAAVALAAPAEPDELLRHCRERLAAFKAPKTVYVLDRIPRTPTGKLQRRRMPAHLGLDGS